MDYARTMLCVEPCGDIMKGVYQYGRWFARQEVDSEM